MIDLNLSLADMLSYKATLKTSHKMRVRITIRDRQEDALESLSLNEPNAPKVISGAVQVDTTQDVTRSLQLVCLDPDHKLTFDSTSPAAGAMFADNFIQVEYGVWVPGLNAGPGWVDVPVFWGPITAFERDGHTVTIEAQGKETLGLDPHLVFRGYTLAKGTLVRDAIKKVMGRVGETRYALGMISGRLHTHRAVIGQEAPWTVCVGGAADSVGNPRPALMSKASGHMYLFFNGRGILTGKRKNGRSCWTFNEEQLGSAPGFSYDILNFRNHVMVKGGTPKKSKKHFKGQATLPPTHPMSPYALRRHGANRYMTEFFESDALKSHDACVKKAEAILASKSNETVSATFDCLPVPHLEEYDMVTLNADGFGITWPLRSFTLPLTSDTLMTVGYLRPVKPRRHR